MTSEPRAFLALDTGAATTVAALIGRVGGRWRLVLQPPGGDGAHLTVVRPEPVEAPVLHHHPRRFQGRLPQRREATMAT